MSARELRYLKRSQMADESRYLEAEDGEGHARPDRNRHAPQEARADAGDEDRARPMAAAAASGFGLGRQRERERREPEEGHGAEDVLALLTRALTAPKATLPLFS